MKKNDELAYILKDFGLEVSGGDFTKEQYEKAHKALTSLIAERERKAVLKELQSFDISEDAIVDVEWYRDAIKLRIKELTEGNDMVKNRWNGFSGSSEPSSQSEEVGDA